MFAAVASALPFNPGGSATLSPLAAASGNASTAALHGSTRCGSEWATAAAHCGRPCSADADCEVGELCFADLPQLPCASRRCGTGWADANSRCGAFCATDAQCLTQGEGCFGALTTAACASVRCGTSFSDADGKCGSFCPRGDECPEGERCFEGLGQLMGSAPC